VTSPPLDGVANAAVIDALAGAFGVRRAAEHGADTSEAKLFRPSLKRLALGDFVEDKSVMSPADA
jgi:uncharacterized protein YggU (UPF0235/DUF167 family)